MYRHDKFTAHFTLGEMIHSSSHPEIDNMPSNVEIERLRYLCVHVLEPLRLQMKCPIHINSGYRCARLNMLVGGKPASAHLYGRAADIRCKNLAFAKKVLSTLALNRHVDMCMIEYNSKTYNFWVHVQTAAGKPRNLVVRSIYVKK